MTPTIPIGENAVVEIKAAVPHATKTHFRIGLSTAFNRLLKLNFFTRHLDFLIILEALLSEKFLYLQFKNKENQLITIL
ncbi:hypothetical protein CXF74_21345 [Psychromonas sp. Urea-02u-13]|nr:hypothetical protein CXF74_21345 [Psychromonas sp. Urea-02u-13]